MKQRTQRNYITVPGPGNEIQRLDAPMNNAVFMQRLQTLQM